MLTFTFVISVCLTRTVNQAELCQVPVSGPATWRPNGKRIETKPRQLPNLFHHEVGVVTARPVCYAHTSSHGVSRYEGMHCLKTDKNGSSFPRPFNRCLLVSTLLTSSPCEDKVEAMACWFTASLTGRVGKGDSLVYLAMVVLIGLVNRIFHKRSDGLEQFLFSARRGMCLFHSLKGDFWAAWLQQPNSFFVCQHSLFLCF